FRRISCASMRPGALPLNPPMLQRFFLFGWDFGCYLTEAQMTAEPAKPGTEQAQLERSLGVFSATTLIVGSMIGSGIFIAPSIMAANVATPGVYLGLWIIGGILTLLGALSYGELCSMMPRAGGQYVFLREAFGPLVAFLYGWTVFLVIQTGFN